LYLERLAVDMAFLRSLHLVGAFLLLVATVLLVITDIAAPVVNNIAIFRVDNNAGQSPMKVYYGTFGYCTNVGQPESVLIPPAYEREDVLTSL